MAQSNVHLYTTGTPNGIKISIMLEELGLPYETTKIEFAKNTQKEPWFLEINPNGRIPAITDTFTDARYDKDHKISYPDGTREAIEVTNWMFFMNAGVGPMQGQSNHFTRYAPEHIEYGVNRYQNETRRLYGVLDKHLSDAKTEYLVGDKCTIADIAHWGWISAALWAGVDINDFPTLKKWEERMWARPAVKKGANVPEEYKMKELLQDPKKMDAHAAKTREWVQKGMKEDAEKNKERGDDKK